MKGKEGTKKLKDDKNKLKESKEGFIELGTDNFLSAIERVYRSHCRIRERFKGIANANTTTQTDSQQSNEILDFDTQRIDFSKAPSPHPIET